MRCKSIKREFVCRSQSLWGWEPLPCHSGAANFLLLHTQTWGLPTVVIVLERDPLLEFQMTASCRGSRWFIKTEQWNKETHAFMLWILCTMNTVWMCSVRFMRLITTVQISLNANNDGKTNCDTFCSHFLKSFLQRCEHSHHNKHLVLLTAVFMKVMEKEGGCRSQQERKEMEEQGHRQSLSRCKLEFEAYIDWKWGSSE